MRTRTGTRDLAPKCPRRRYLQAVSRRLLTPIPARAAPPQYTPAAIEDLIARYEDAFFVFEATSGCDDALRQLLTSAKVPFARVNPRRAREFAKAAGVLAKTDRVDARVLAELGLRLELTPTVEPAQERRALSELVARRDQLVEEILREKNRLRLAKFKNGRRETARRAACRTACREPTRACRRAPAGTGVVSGAGRLSAREQDPWPSGDQLIGTAFPLSPPTAARVPTPTPTSRRSGSVYAPCRGVGDAVPSGDHVGVQSGALRTSAATSRRGRDPSPRRRGCHSPCVDSGAVAGRRQLQAAVLGGLSDRSARLPARSYHVSWRPADGCALWYIRTLSDTEGWRRCPPPGPRVRLRRRGRWRPSHTRESGRCSGSAGGPTARRPSS